MKQKPEKLSTRIMLTSIRRHLKIAAQDRVLEGYLEPRYRERKQQLFRQLPRRIVEIGPGPGTNFKYYKPGTSVIAIEPYEIMRQRLRENAEKYGIHLQLIAGKGEDLEIASDSIDAVVCTLVLCSVDEPKTVVSEIHRILKPTRQLIFLEHVAAAQNTGLRQLQRGIRRPWKWFFAGCHVTRETGALLRSSFSSITLESFFLEPKWIPASPHIIGRATK